MQVLNERFYVGIWLRGTGTEHTVTLHEMMMVTMLGTPSPGCMSPTRTVVLAQRFPELGELVVMVGWVSRWEENHVVAIAKGHELQTPKPDHHGQ
jgi:hypothetical protein